jgi:hypothetical protein
MNQSTSFFGETKQNVALIDIRNLASSLQANFASIASAEAQKRGNLYFHVEVGITMWDQQLLDH